MPIDWVSPLSYKYIDTYINMHHVTWHIYSNSNILGQPELFSYSVSFLCSWTHTIPIQGRWKSIMAKSLKKTYEKNKKEFPSLALTFQDFPMNWECGPYAQSSQRQGQLESSLKPGQESAGEGPANGGKEQGHVLLTSCPWALETLLVASCFSCPVTSASLSARFRWLLGSLVWMDWNSGMALDYW